MGGYPEVGSYSERPGDQRLRGVYPPLRTVVARTNWLGGGPEWSFCHLRSRR